MRSWRITEVYYHFTVCRATQLDRRSKLPVGQSARAHAATHVVVENQAAMGDATAVPATLARLMREGLERHDAVHAIGSVLMQIIFDMSTKHRGTRFELIARLPRTKRCLIAT
jgi:hypothetical protein